MSKSINSDHVATDQISENAHESMDEMISKARKAEKRIREEAAHLQADAQQAGQKTMERTDDTLESISVLVRDNPLISLGVAFGAGTLLSALKRQS